eukprot:gnl/MRDRNA2_/MRDRNA2_63723_c0_seq1.p1 gnl/MRDRNA2_/MRDRNA2_63723_c0~~gnl/MRDRNA2_/MRDRNA2_63723_c0_seq1.p1  ORF type:complete len:434 (+),score=56.31 gnl/MRDRNA2_/MRDRNA2_63723_c0_seq1:74-1375(+)
MPEKDFMASKTFIEVTSPASADEQIKKSARSRASSPAPKISDKNQTEALERIKGRRLVIPEEGLKQIAEHKYVPGTYTPIDGIMNTYFWTPLVEYLPKWIAPNAVTVLGLILQVVGFAAVAYHCPDFHNPAPKWAYLLATLSIFGYQTLDALDGKQARRTGSSSPLGQLFDHGCDSVVTIFLGMLTAMCLHLGFSVRCVTFVFCMLLPFWMAQWSEYHAHVLPTSIGGVVGVTEAQFISMGIAFVNIVSPGFWLYDVGVGNLPSWWCGEAVCPVSLNDTIVGTQLILAALGISQCVRAVLTKTTHKRQAMLQTLPVWMLAVLGYLWCITVRQSHPRLVIFSLGVSFSYMTCKMIVAAMSRTPYTTFQSALIPLPIIYIVARFELLPRHNDVLLGAYVAVSIYSMAHWIRSAIEEISHYIGIHTFRLGPRKKLV